MKIIRSALGRAGHGARQGMGTHACHWTVQAWTTSHTRRTVQRSDYDRGGGIRELRPAISRPSYLTKDMSVCIELTSTLCFAGNSLSTCGAVRRYFTGLPFRMHVLFLAKFSGVVVEADFFSRKYVLNNGFFRCLSSLPTI